MDRLLPLLPLALLLLGGATAVPPALRPSGLPVNTAPRKVIPPVSLEKALADIEKSDRAEKDVPIGADLSEDVSLPNDWELVPDFSAPPEYEDTSAREGGAGDKADAPPPPTELLPGAEVDGNAAEHIIYEDPTFAIDENNTHKEIRTPEAELSIPTHKKPVTRTKRSYNCNYVWKTGYQSICCDNHPHCPSWAAAGHCSSNPGYMLVNCRSSCRVC